MGSNRWTWVKREQTKPREHLLLMIFFYSGHLQHEHGRPDMEQKYINSYKKAQWKEPEFTTLMSEVGGGTNIKNKQAHILQYKS